jgi:hypothetical protein
MRTESETRISEALDLVEKGEEHVLAIDRTVNGEDGGTFHRLIV